MRILFITNHYPTTVAQQRAWLEQLGCEIDLLYIDSQTSRVAYLKALWSLIRQVQIGRRYDLVHAHEGAWVGLIAGLQRRVPTLITMHGSDLLDPAKRSVSRLAARLAQQVLVMSDEMRRVLDRNHVEVLPYGVDIMLFRPMSKRIAQTELGLSASKKYILFPYDTRRAAKRYALAKQALKIVRYTYPEAQLVTLSQASPDRVALYNNACDALLLCSKYEGAPIAIREAIACNLPIVSTDVGDVAAMIDGLDQCYLSADRPEELAHYLCQVLAEGRRANGAVRRNQISGQRAAQRIKAFYAELALINRLPRILTTR